VLQAGVSHSTDIKNGIESGTVLTDVVDPPKRKEWSMNPITDRPLILYAYAETPNARTNLEYFVAHGLHAAADFIFLLNGETDAANLIPKKSNIKVIQRPNECYDIGAYGETLTNGDLYMKYKRFIMLNASIRGPFLPYWSEQCWSDMFLGRVTDEVKVCRSLPPVFLSSRLAPSTKIVHAAD
jgi:hypothetical protein